MKSRHDRADEMRAHIELYVEELVARGRTPEEAMREARLRFGNPRVKIEEIDDMNRLPILDVLWRDVRYAVRVLRRSPAFALTAIVTLALVVGANGAVFSLANAILLRPLPYPHPERLAMVVTRVPPSANVQDAQDGMSWEMLYGQVRSVDVALAAGGFATGVNLVVDRAASSVVQSRVSAGYFRVLGVAPLVGREFTGNEDRPGGPAVAVLSYGLWQRIFDGDRTAVGRTILLRGEAYEVVGVMPQTFQNPGEPADVWTPARPSRTGEGSGTNYEVIARVRDGHTWQEADGELAALSAGRWPAPSDAPDKPMPQWTLRPMQEELTLDARQPIEMLAGAVGLVLLIACVNIAALLLARGGSRTKEMATRMALGSGRRAVVRQLMVESAVLGLAGGAAGLLVGYLGLEGLKALGGHTFSEWTRVTLDVRVLAVTLGVALLTSLVFGLVPALQASRLDVNAALSEGGSRSIAGGSRHWIRRGLVSAEVALGVVLLVATGLLVRTFVNLQSLDPGFNPANLTTVGVSLQDARYRTAVEVNRLFDESLAALRATPGVESAAVSLELPYRRLLNSGFKFTDGPASPDYSIANFTYVTPGFFRTFQIPLRAGRVLDNRDRAGAPRVAVVNDQFVRSWSQGRNPIGRRLREGGGTGDIEIVGVVGDVQETNSGISFPGRTAGPHPIETTPLVFVPASQQSDAFFRLVHTWFTPVWTVRAASSVNVAAALRTAIGGADPLLPLGRIQSMSAVRASATSEQRLLMTLVGVLAAAALLLALIGIYGLVAHAVVERTREFGIRMALGATAAQTIALVARSGIVLAAVGALVGVGLARVAVQLVESFLFGVDSHDPMTYAAVAVLLVGVSVVASVVPALRILRVDPAETLR